MNADIQDLVRKAMRRSFYFGQTYWQQADSESYSENKKSESTSARFEVLITETLEEIANAGESK